MRYRRSRALVVFSVVVACLSLPGCAALSLVSYYLWPDYPLFADGEQLALDGLQSEVKATRRPDGLWHVEADNESDGVRVLGYLQARDRMGQLDLFRYLARGEVAALVGDRPFTGKSSIDVDRLNRFLGFRRDAAGMLAKVSPEERAVMDSFVAGINAWIAEGVLPLEHRLLEVDSIRPWMAEDSMAIYLMIMHGLGGNADREIRRLAIACAAGLDAMERVWPTDMSYDFSSLPSEDWGGERFAVAPGVVREIAEELPGLCPPVSDRVAQSGQLAGGSFAGGFDALWRGWSASNNWATTGSHTASGGAFLASDPHLPHMNPPIVWGFDLATPEFRTVGFTLPGLHRVVFGHNGSVAWGATTNHVDRQDLVVHKPRSETIDGEVVEGYEVDGAFVAFEKRTEIFDVRGGESVTATVRFTRDGPLMNDLSNEVAGLPLVALRAVPMGRGRDLDGARALARASTVEDFAEAIDQLDLGCSSWLAGDANGSIAYRAPCMLPVRDGWRGTFPIPGWTTRYDWKGFYDKSRLPRSDNPARGWLATANNQIVPPDTFASAYNNDESAPDRVARIAELIRERSGKLDRDRSASIQLDRRDSTWRRLQPELAEGFCKNAGEGGEVERARRIVCDWDGTMAPDSVAATLYTHWTLAMIDRALADDLPGGADGELWHFVQSLYQFEAVVRWTWNRSEADDVWDDSSTPEREQKSEVLEAAFADAVAEVVDRYGADADDWQWGQVRPFVLEHVFAGGSAALAGLVNSEPIAIGGGNETVFKHQFLRSDRAEMKVIVGPVVRINVDLGDPWSATFAMAGGDSGWPGSPYYANLLEDWAEGVMRPLSPEAGVGDVVVRFGPSEKRRQ